jgi:CBS domain-containing protein
LVGVLTRKDLIAGLGRYGPEGHVGEVMERDFVTVEPGEMLQTALAKLQDCHCRTLPVVDDGRLVGLVTADNLAEVLMVQQALRRARRPRQGTGRAPGRDRNGFPLRPAGTPGRDGRVWADAATGNVARRN